MLYLTDGTIVPWNGLTGVEDNTAHEGRSFYMDGVKYLETVTPGDFSGRLRALTYPDEFDSVNGIGSPAPGLSYHDQPPQSFSLSYRTRVGNDIDGTEHGYKIHLLYNLVANPDAVSYATLADPSTPIEFAWTLNGVPPVLRRSYRPTVHISIDSTKADPETVTAIENVLYGTDVTAPRLPGIDELTDLFQALGVLIIVDNGDGTWTAIDVGNDYISMINPTTFRIDNADAVFLDATTYQISTTEAD